MVSQDSSNGIDYTIQNKINSFLGRLDYLHLLIEGDKSKGLILLRELYKRASENLQYTCTFHDASKIKSAKDFFVPILKSKYGDEYYDVLKLGDTVENILDEYDTEKS